ncbi:hypothetical protein JOQ06_027835 [Pogonophryne albipinna]|uniref:Transposable element P transposase-like RNase H domain-containing protein n=1 Tax=Pogonophryne albipinna TaxID=1090488 RepID=A0AAD6F3U4_9TELE|nr:hypothetical protein JOQ06_027835 [Pogonophryne albipinna]
MGLPELCLKQDCPTRWNSTFYMLKRFYEMKEAVITTLALVNPGLLTLSPEEWEEIKEASDVLKPFEEVTVEVSCERWLCSVDGKPGLNKMMLDMLERRCQEDQAKYGCVALMLDAMAIRKHVQYNPHNQSMSGFVDMGDGNNETNVATEALVFMVVGLQGHWKAPIAYYLTKSLSPETQRVLLSHALEELHARGIRVVSVTMDGHASNVSMCNQLGCELKGNPQEPLKTSFPHPSTGDKVFVMMDACHMLKLARNMLQEFSLYHFVISLYFNLNNLISD